MKLTTHISILLLFTFLIACSDDTGSPEDEIRGYVSTAELAAENRDISGLAELIHDQYRDQKELDKQQLQKLVRAYFFRHKNIHLITRIDRIDIQSENRAFAVVYAAMTANAVNSTSELASLHARVYRFELQLVKDNQWYLQQANWKASNIRNMLGGN